MHVIQAYQVFCLLLYQIINIMQNQQIKKRIISIWQSILGLKSNQVQQLIFQAKNQVKNIIGNNEIQKIMHSSFLKYIIYQLIIFFNQKMSSKQEIKTKRKMHQVEYRLSEQKMGCLAKIKDIKNLLEIIKNENKITKNSYSINLQELKALYTILNVIEHEVLALQIKEVKEMRQKNDENLYQLGMQDTQALIQQLQQIIKKKEKRIKELNNQLQQNFNDKVQLEQQIQILQQKLDHFEQQLKEKDQIISQLQQKLNAKEQNGSIQFLQKIKKIKNIENQNYLKDKFYLKNIKQRQQQQNQINEIKQQLESQYHGKYKRQIDQIIKKYERLVNQLKKQSQHKIQSLKQIKKIQNISKYQKIIRQKQQTINQLSQKMASTMNNQLKDKSKYMEIKLYEFKIQELQSSVDLLQKQNIKLKEIKYNGSEEDVLDDNQYSEIRIYQEMIKSLENNNQKLKNQNKKLVSSLNNLQISFNQYEDKQKEELLFGSNGYYSAQRKDNCMEQKRTQENTQFFQENMTNSTKVLSKYCFPSQKTINPPQKNHEQKTIKKNPPKVIEIQDEQQQHEQNLLQSMLIAKPFKSFDNQNNQQFYSRIILMQALTIEMTLENMLH